MKKPIPVIDLFAGPGGLNEGFSRLDEDSGRPAFETVGSYEMESTAISTLRLRSAYRHLLRKGGVPDEYYEYIKGEITLDDFKRVSEVQEAFEAAEAHVHQVELGGENDDAVDTIRSALGNAGVLDQRAAWVLIGGPPCQAYSLAGRSRRTNDPLFAKDKKHFLYREYLNIIRSFEPPVFVMENVKGLLSSTTNGASMFELILEDLRNLKSGLDYDVYSLVTGAAPKTPADLIIRAEEYGVPQKRHRVILLGIRRGFFPETTRVGSLTRSDEEVTVRDALRSFTPLRSGISPVSADSGERWTQIRDGIAKAYGSQGARRQGNLHRGARSTARSELPESEHFREWVIDPRLDSMIQHESRNHMEKDLERYWYASTAAIGGTSPKLSEFPKDLQPNHKNADLDSHPFEDRFRVQVWDKPSTTIVSHISKDGHYYIHPDPDQMRSLTVREAARLQTFPDNYFFVGSRTQQYHQVGNAVPPLLANQIAQVVADLFDSVDARD